MSHIVISSSWLKKQVETKAFAYGVSDVISTLLGEYVVYLIHQHQENNTNYSASTPYGNNTNT